ncbi:Uncharacterized protein Fot_21876 [Forsythia ovata]|uniref:Uncharacterized protein n=1 Tax=Forsythia ovata TaxID=205694 RepID=A0ABD1UW42_9LAMI
MAKLLPTTVSGKLVMWSSEIDIYDAMSLPQNIYGIRLQRYHSHNKLPSIFFKQYTYTRSSWSCGAGCGHSFILGGLDLDSDHNCIVRNFTNLSKKNYYLPPPSLILFSFSA